MPDWQLTHQETFDAIGIVWRKDKHWIGIDEERQIVARAAVAKLVRWLDKRMLPASSRYGDDIVYLTVGFWRELKKELGIQG